MNNIFKHTFLTLVFSFSLFSNAQDIKIGEKHTIESKILNEKREVWISLPESYQENGYKKYPVLYFYDADFNGFFQTFSGMVKQMSSDASPVIPEMIVVGIVSQQRSRDSSPTHSQIQYGGKESKSKNNTGGADKFLTFVHQELIPSIENQYQTSDYRVIAGYSFTGLPVIQSLYTAPEVFNAYLAIDPSMWWDDQFLLKQYDNFLSPKELDKRRLFIATSVREQNIYPKENYVMSFIETLRSKPQSGLSVGSVTFGTDENHHTMPILSFYKGLRYIFEGYMIDNEARFRSAGLLKEHFQKVSAKLGSNFYLREDLINWFGYDRLYNDQFGIDINRAIEFFTLNTELYPQSANAWNSLAEGYLVAGQKPSALTAYKKSLLLEPGNVKLNEKIKQLESD